MTPAEIILAKVDEKLDGPAELTLFGRAAIQMGFENPPEEYALSKLMRDDPQDRADADFIVRNGKLSLADIAEAIKSARIPDIAEIREQFDLCARRFV